MDKLNEAIQIEQWYYEQANANLPHPDLSELLAPLGFTIESYQAACRDLVVKKMNFSFKEVYPENAAEEMIQMISSHEPGLLMMNTDKIVVYHGNENFNRGYCEEHNIPVIDYLTGGGTLVASSGELSIGVSIPNGYQTDFDWFLNKLNQIMNNLGENSVVDNNDILIDGNKVAAIASYMDGYVYAYVAQFSFDDKSELISNICPLPSSGKYPGFITKFTRNDLREAIKNWLL